VCKTHLYISQKKLIQVFLSNPVYYSTHMKLLIVEDNHTIAESIQKGLQTHGYAVDVAYDGLDGFDLAINETYDVILLDLMLPGKNGMEICSELRSEGNTTPILMLTARGSLEDKVGGLQTGADDYLVKPFQFAELVARVQALARRQKAFQHEVLEYDDVRVDTAAMTVLRDDVPISLSKREFSLLVYLLKNAGRVLSKDQILEAVWEFDADVLPNTVEVYVGYLRAKLEKPFSSKPTFIKTVRGFGYTIQEDQKE